VSIILFFSFTLTVPQRGLSIGRSCKLCPSVWTEVYSQSYISRMLLSHFYYLRFQSSVDSTFVGHGPPVYTKKLRTP